MISDLHSMDGYEQVFIEKRIRFVSRSINYSMSGFNWRRMTDNEQSGQTRNTPTEDRMIYKILNFYVSVWGTWHLLYRFWTYWLLSILSVIGLVLVTLAWPSRRMEDVISAFSDKLYTGAANDLSVSHYWNERSANEPRKTTTSLFLFL